MNLDLTGFRRDGERRMHFDARALMNDSFAILRRFDWYALLAAVAMSVLFDFGLDMNPVFSLVLGVAVYAGVALLRPRSPELAAAVAEPATPEEEAFLRARQATVRVHGLAGHIENEKLRERVQAIGRAFDRMLDVMEEDKEYASAPNYETELVEPFSYFLANYVRLNQRGIDLANPQLANFEKTVVPQVEVFAKSFYQHYHDGDVIDLAARLEIFWSNLESRDEEADDATAETDEATGVDDDLKEARL